MKKGKYVIVVGGVSEQY